MGMIRSLAALDIYRHVQLGRTGAISTLLCEITLMVGSLSASSKTKRMTITIRIASAFSPIMYSIVAERMSVRDFMEVPFFANGRSKGSSVCPLLSPFDR